MNLFQTELIDQYCERIADGLTAEPINVISSFAFIVAALILIRKLLPQKDIHQFWDTWLLAITLAAIGAGSVTWHSVARSWAQLTDLLPISLFISIFLLSFLVRVAKLKLGWVIGLFSIFHLFNFVVTKTVPAEFMNGSMFYAPAWAALMMVVVFLHLKTHPLRHSYALAVLLLSISIFFRSIDQAFCTAMPLGTHFLWHLINALVLYLLVAGLVTHAGKTDNIIKL
ncbi:MAG TPA: hypothetical protein DD827_07240 [Gammaproteobacteria bacterium]|nr:hypothetical protein [Gammaproteobacteria bacterium]